MQAYAATQPGVNSSSRSRGQVGVPKQTHCRALDMHMGRHTWQGNTHKRCLPEQLPAGASYHAASSNVHFSDLTAVNSAVKTRTLYSQTERHSYAKSTRSGRLCCRDVRWVVSIPLPLGPQGRVHAEGLELQPGGIRGPRAGCGEPTSGGLGTCCVCSGENGAGLLVSTLA